MKKIEQKKMLNEESLDKMANVKAEIQGFQLWVDDARTNRIAKIRYRKVKDRLRELVAKHKNLTKKYEERISGKERL